MNIDDYTPEMAHAAAERGAAWLDEHCVDWVARIDLQRLDLGSQSACMLGQTAECLLGKPATGQNFSRVLNHFEESVTWAETQGFDVPIHRFVLGKCGERCNTELRARYEMLTIAWRELIGRRLELQS